MCLECARFVRGSENDIARNRGKVNVDGTKLVVIIYQQTVFQYLYELCDVLCYPFFGRPELHSNLTDDFLN